LYFLEVLFPCTFQTRTDQQEMIFVLISCFTVYKWRRYCCCILILCFVAYIIGINERCKADQLEKKSLQYLQIQDRPISKPHNIWQSTGKSGEINKEQTCDAVIYATKHKIKIQQQYLLHLYTVKQEMRAMIFSQAGLLYIAHLCQYIC
jgi:hypothetical protein